MKVFLISITVVSSILMIIVILLQQGKGAELGSAFGRGAQGGLFTASGKANFLTRTTSALVTIFLLSSLALSIFLSGSRQDGIFDELGGGEAGSVEAVESLDTLLEQDGLEAVTKEEEAVETVDETEAATDETPLSEQLPN